MAVKACLPTLDVSSTFVAHASSASSTSSSTQTSYQHKKSIYRQQRSLSKPCQSQNESFYFASNEQENSTEDCLAQTL